MLISCKYRKITAITYYCEAFGTRNWIESLESWIKNAFRRKFIVPKSFLYNSTLRYLLCRLKVVGWIDKFCTLLSLLKSNSCWLVFKICITYILNMYSVNTRVLRTFENKGSNTGNLIHFKLCKWISSLTLLFKSLTVASWWIQFWSWKQL